MEYKIYKLISPEGKIYIGCTKAEKLYDRWQYGSGYKSNKMLYKDIYKFGWKNFRKEIIDTTDNIEEAHLLERKYILEYNSNIEEFGYNKHTNFSLVRIKRPKGIKVIRKDTKEIFESYAAAAISIGVSKEAIRLAIKENRPCKNIVFEKI